MDGIMRGGPFQNQDREGGRRFMSSHGSRLFLFFVLALPALGVCRNQGKRMGREWVKAAGERAGRIHFPQPQRHLEPKDGIPVCAKLPPLMELKALLKNTLEK
jgi:hypothetical protein